jgi:excisionase family DNA binding protein
LGSSHPGITGRKAGDELEPLAVSPRQACLLLGVGNTRLYELIRNRELDSYQEGRARRITLESIRRRVAGLVAAASATDAAIEAAPPRRRRGRHQLPLSPEAMP